MAGISRSVTLVIAYLMQYYGLPMQQAYQFVKDKRPAISPNLNFMGQLLEFDRTIKEHKLTQFLDISAYRPTAEQEKLLENMRAKSSESSSMETTLEPVRCNEPMPQQFVLKSLVPTARHKMTMPIQGVGESKSVPAVLPKVEGKTNPIASLQPCSVSAHTCFGPELVEFSAPPFSIGSVTDPTPDEQSTEQQIALVYTLQNCHSIQEVIYFCLLASHTYHPDNQHTNYKVVSEHLRGKVEHLVAKNSTLCSSFESAKQAATLMYHHSNMVEANNTRLRHTLCLCQQAFDVLDLVSEMRDARGHDPRNPAHAGFGFSMNECGSLTTLRSPDNQKQSLAARSRAVLQKLEGMPEIQVYLPTNLGTHTWTLSQTTGTSGLSSISGSVEIDMGIEQLKMYAQALRSNIHHLLSTLTPLDGFKGLETIKNPEKSQLYKLEVENRHMELKVCHASLLVKQYECKVKELCTQLSDKRRANKVDPAKQDLAMDLQEREKRLAKRYKDLFMFMLSHVQVSHQNAEQLMGFANDLRIANCALVEAFESRDNGFGGGRRTRGGINQPGLLGCCGQVGGVVGDVHHSFPVRDRSILADMTSVTPVVTVDEGLIVLPEALELASDEMRSCGSDQRLGAKRLMAKLFLCRGQFGNHSVCPGPTHREAVIQ
ncbi:hypothetical protein EMCRGX_G019407 [Ephydatia muelleri]